MHMAFGNHKLESTWASGYGRNLVVLQNSRSYYELYYGRPALLRYFTMDFSHDTFQKNSKYSEKLNSLNTAFRTTMAVYGTCKTANTICSVSSSIQPMSFTSIS
jgi:hypothetical protein